MLRRRTDVGWGLGKCADGRLKRYRRQAARIKRGDAKACRPKQRRREQWLGPDFALSLRRPMLQRRLLEPREKRSLDAMLRAWSWAERVLALEPAQSSRLERALSPTRAWGAVLAASRRRRQENRANTFRRSCRIETQRIEVLSSAERLGAGMRARCT
jgi:hypothetical protein